jgi:hypothetical protein
MSTVLKALIFAALNLVGVYSVSACSCEGLTPVCSVYWKTSNVFLGRVVGIDHVYDQSPTDNLIGPGHFVTRFAVLKAYRGAVAEQVVVRTADQGSSCGFSFEQGRDYLVYADSGSNGELATNHCTRTHRVASAADDADIQWIEGLAKALPGASIFGKIQSRRLNGDDGYVMAPLAGTPVSVRGPESRTVSSDANGQFRVDGLAPGKYVVSAEAPMHYSPFSPWTVTLDAQTCAEIPWITQIDGQIAGHVYLSDGTPAVGFFMNLKAADPLPGQWNAPQETATTDSNGGFRFDRLPSGSYVFGVNLDFAPFNGKPYYRKVFYPGTEKLSEAAVIGIGLGQVVDNVRFILPPDSPAPSVPISVSVVGFDGKPVPRATIMAQDSMWDSSVTLLTASTDFGGTGLVVLRPGSRYDVWAVVNMADSQACAEPQSLNTDKQSGPIVLVLSHHFGNCSQFKKH